VSSTSVNTDWHSQKEHTKYILDFSDQIQKTETPFLLSAPQREQSTYPLISVYSVFFFGKLFLFVFQSWSKVSDFSFESVILCLSILQQLASLHQLQLLSPVRNKVRKSLSTNDRYIYDGQRVGEQMILRHI